MIEQDLDTALAPITQAQRLLAEATTFEDFRNLRDMASTAKAYAKARGMGIDAENTAAEYILRAERGMGKTLIEMGLTGERATSGRAPGRKDGRRRSATGIANPVSLHELIGAVNEPTSRALASQWQRLAREWEDDTFEERIAHVKALGARLSKVDFYRPAKKAAKRDAATIREAKDDEMSTTLAAFVRAAGVLMDEMSQLSNDDLTRVATCIRALADRYNTVKATR